MRAWLNLLPSLWPLLAGAWLFVEVTAYFGSRRSLRFLVLAWAIVSTLLVIVDYATQPTSYALQTRPVAYFALVARTVVVPLTVLSVGAYLLGKIERAAWRQPSLCLLALVVTAALPIFALWSACAGGVDCI